MSFDFNSSGGSDNYNNDRVSERDRLEIDSNGRTRNENANQQDMQSGRGGSGRRFGGGSGGAGRPGKWKWRLGVGSVVGLIILGSVGSGGGVSDIWRTFNSTPEENLGSMLTSVKQVEHENKMVGKEKNAVYDVNNIFSDEYIDKQVDKEYAVYVYTGNEKYDKPFDDWVKKTEKEIPIYRVNAEGMKTNVVAMDYVEADKPMVMVYNEVEKGKKGLDAVIKDKDLLKNIVPHIQKIQEGKGVKLDKKEKSDKS